MTVLLCRSAGTENANRGNDLHTRYIGRSRAIACREFGSCAKTRLSSGVPIEVSLRQAEMIHRYCQSRQANGLARHRDRPSVQALGEVRTAVSPWPAHSLIEAPGVMMMYVSRASRRSVCTSASSKDVR